MCMGFSVLFLFIKFFVREVVFLDWLKLNIWSFLYIGYLVIVIFLIIIVIFLIFLEVNRLLICKKIVLNNND